MVRPINKVAISIQIYELERFDPKNPFHRQIADNGELFDSQDEALKVKKKIRRLLRDEKKNN